MAGKNDTPVNQNPPLSHCCDDKVSNKRFDDHVKWIKWIAGGLFTAIFYYGFVHLNGRIDDVYYKYSADHDTLLMIKQTVSTYQADHDKIIAIETIIKNKFQR